MTQRVVSLSFLVSLAASGVGCTTLGPMPASRGLSPLPAGRPDVRVDAGLTPGYYLSSATQESYKSAAVPQLGIDLEPDRWLQLPGVHVGVRYVGEPAEGGFAEPHVGYRRTLDAEGRFGAGVVAYGGFADGASQGASFQAIRAGGEVGADARLTPVSSLLELHLSARVALTGLSAKGQYCLGAQGRYGVDCDDPPTTAVSARAGGLYPSVTGGVALETGRHLDSVFHGVRLELLGSAGTMPQVEYARQTDAAAYYAAGAGLSVAFGAK